MIKLIFYLFVVIAFFASLIGMPVSMIALLWSDNIIWFKIFGTCFVSALSLFVTLVGIVQLDKEL